MLRWIDELNGVVGADARAKEIMREIRALTKEQDSWERRAQIRTLYTELDELQFKPDYMCLIIDYVKDYHRACKGFSINGIKYRRLLGTNGGIKNSTIVFVSERLWPELNRRVENGRNPDMPLVTAKLEAYKALTCSASIPVSFPNGVLVVNDAETTFTSDIIYITDKDTEEPITEERHDETITLNASDGFGIMLPSLAERWSQELGLNYMVSGANSRFSFEKGMVFTFDFLDFAENVAHSYIVKDAWGNEVDIRGVELVLTTSMVKLWDSYDNCADYIEKSKANGYTFGITKTAPKELDNEQTLNYQYIQSYNLDDDDIDELIAPTVDEISDVLGGDWRKTVLFLKGIGLTADNVQRLPDDYAKAIMIDQRMLDDPYIQNTVYQLIRNRIDRAKIGVLKVHGNYSIVSGDPYLLCQSIFGLEKTGLLKAGEIYNRYWADCGANKLVCFRAPMSIHSNIRLVHPMDNDDLRHWFQYMTTVTVFNAWDTASAALNGLDYDGDMVLLTDNNILVNRHKQLPALMCAQRKAAKKISTEEDFVCSNIDSFGNEIGQTTNWITSMYEVQSKFQEGSKEYDVLSYRIMAGQLYQQNSIDKAKGIICKPMPRVWHDWREVNRIEDNDKRELYRSIVADKKPSFMRYIYPELMRKYNTYVRNANRNALREFQMTVDEIDAMACKDLTDRQEDFLYYYKKRMPVGVGKCVMNRICWKIEEKFDGYIGEHNAKKKFDYRIMKGPEEYTRRQYDLIKNLYNNYNSLLSDYSLFADYERVSDYERTATLSNMRESFLRQCLDVCSNTGVLCNILLDMCYKRQSTRSFCWSMSGPEIIRNLLLNNGSCVSFPTLDEAGDLEYGGRKFKTETIIVKDDVDGDNPKRA